MHDGWKQPGWLCYNSLKVSLRLCCGVSCAVQHLVTNKPVQCHATTSILMPAQLPVYATVPVVITAHELQQPLLASITANSTVCTCWQCCVSHCSNRLSSVRGWLPSKVFLPYFNRTVCIIVDAARARLKLQTSSTSEVFTLTISSEEGCACLR
jgi:hypothetical protein